MSAAATSPARRIVCLGTTPAIARSMAFDRFTPGAVNRAARVSMMASGKSINAARVAHTLGARVTCVGVAGGTPGRWMVEQVTEAGMSADFVEVAPPTRTCVTIIDRAAREATELVEPSGAVNAAAGDRLVERLKTHLCAGDVLVLSGSLAPGIDDRFYARCADVASSAGAEVIVDATGAPLRHALARRPAAVKPNRAELGETVGMPVDTEPQLRDAMRRLIDMGPRWAVVTLGAGGVALGDVGGFWRITVPAVDVVSPIGSGDSLAGAMAAGLARGLAMTDAALLGAAAATANCLSAEPGVVSPADVERIRASLTLQPW